MRKVLVKILTIVTLIIGTATIFQTSNKIMKTSFDLIMMRDSASYYNEQYRKTDAMTEKYLKLDAERQKIYNSEDTVIRVFSNQKALVKIFIMICAAISYPLILYMWLSLIIREFVRYVRRRNRRKRREAVPKEERKSGVAWRSEGNIDSKEKMFFLWYKV